MVSWYGDRHKDAMSICPKAQLRSEKEGWAGAWAGDEME